MKPNPLQTQHLSVKQKYAEGSKHYKGAYCNRGECAKCNNTLCTCKCHPWLVLK